MKKILIGFITIGLLSFVGCKNDDGNTSVNSTKTTPNSTDLAIVDSAHGGIVNTNTSSTNTNSSSLIETTKIGEQEWMTKNLNLDHFQNGDKIQEAKTEAEWVKAGNNKEPAWYYYDNNSLNGEKYGKLYNFYAVSDPRGLAPNGWHIPSDAEWTVLTDYLGANGNKEREGIALKSKSGWKDYEGQSGNGTDDYGWLGLPGGYRDKDGYVYPIGYFGTFWSSSGYYTSSAWNREVENDYASVYRWYASKSFGFSVRCLRD